MGRPCVIFFSDDNYDYLLPLSSTKKDKNYYGQIKNEYFELSTADLHYSYNKKTNDAVIHLAEPFRRKISGYEIIGKLKKTSYANLIKAFSDFNKEDLEDTINKISNR